MKPIRVLQIVTIMNRGGLESMLMNYYRNIDRSRVQFDFLEHRSGLHDFTQEINALDGKLFSVPNIDPLNMNGYSTKLNDFFKQNKDYKIVHSHLDCMSAFPLKIAQVNEIPIRIAHSHNTNQELNWKYPVKIISKKFIPKYANVLFACGNEAGKWMYGKKTFSVLNNAIDASKFSFNDGIRNDVRKELGLESGEFIVGHVGRFNKQKNHKFIIQVFNEVVKINSNSKLLLVGVGELEDEVKKIIDRMNISNKVIFLGIRNDINRIMQAFDIFLFPSLFEGLPVTLIEAQAAGLQCVISDTISSESIITSNVKTLSLDEKPLVWAQLLLEIINSHERTNTYEQIRNHGFDIKQNAKWLEEFYINEYNTIK